MQPILELTRIEKSYGETLVPSDINLTITEGELVAIVGRSGSGKTTLLSILAGLVKPDGGQITLNGKPIQGPNLQRAVVFQHDSLLPWRSVAGNVGLAIEQAFPDAAPQQRARWIAEYLEMVMMSAASRKKPSELSGGMKQRAAVARALSTSPSILLLDEPFGALDALTRSSLQDQLLQIHQENRRTTVLVTNDVDEALLLADRIVVLSEGPAATLGTGLRVPLERPRHRKRLQQDATYQQLRLQVVQLFTGVPQHVSKPPSATFRSSASQSGPASKGGMLEVRGLTKSFSSRTDSSAVVRDFTLTIAEHEFVCLIGHSGCGKTTVLSMVAGLTSPTAGEILLDGIAIKGAGIDRAVVFQSHALLPQLTALGNVMLAVGQAYSRAAKKEHLSIATHLLQRVGLSEYLHRYPAELSGGMRQRVGVARALALHPRLLLLDEPFGSLDSSTRYELQSLLQELQHQNKNTTLMITHDVDEALFLADRIVMMTRGPEATVGGTVHVPFAHPRDRTAMLRDPVYYQLREQLVDFLEKGAVMKPIHNSGCLTEKT